MTLESYHCNLACRAWQNAQKAELSPEFFNSSLFKIGDVEGFCGEKNGILYISFQGTYGKADVISDLNFKKTSIGNKIKVHTGFLKQYKQVEGFLFEKILNANKIIFTGVSLGSGLAALSAYHIKQSCPKKDVACVLFSCPRIGNKIFIESFNGMLIETKHYKFIDDPIPNLPPFWLGYKQISTPIVFGKRKWWEWLLLPITKLGFGFWMHLPEKYYGFKL